MAPTPPHPAAATESGPYDVPDDSPLRCLTKRLKEPMAWCSSGRSRPQDRLHGKGMTVIRSLPPKHILKARTTDRNQPKENSSPIRKHPVMSVRAVHGDPLSKLNDPTAVRTIRATIISRTPQPCRSYRFSAVPFADSLTPLQSDKNQDREVGGCAFAWEMPHCRTCP